MDLAHQVEVLELLVDLNQCEGRTVVLRGRRAWMTETPCKRAGTFAAAGEPGSTSTLTW